MAVLMFFVSATTRWGDGVLLSGWVEGCCCIAQAALGMRTTCCWGESLVCIAND